MAKKLKTGLKKKGRKRAAEPEYSQSSARLEEIFGDIERIRQRVRPHKGLTIRQMREEGRM